MRERDRRSLGVCLPVGGREPEDLNREGDDAGVQFPGVCFIVKNEGEDLQVQIRDLAQKVHDTILSVKMWRTGSPLQSMPLLQQEEKKPLESILDTRFRNSPDGRDTELIKEITKLFIFLVKGMGKLSYLGVTRDCSYAEVNHRRILARG